MFSGGAAMRFTMPAVMPTKREFVLTFFQARFPEVTNGSYTRLCADALGLNMCQNYDGNNLRVGSDMYRLMAEMVRNYQNIYNQVYSPKKKADTLSDFVAVTMNWMGYQYDDLLKTFASENGSISGWLRGEGSEGFINNKHLAVALFFTYLMFTDTNQSRMQETAKIAFTECLERLGITDIDPDVAKRLFTFDWNDNGCEDTFHGKAQPFITLNCPGIVLFGTTVLVLTTLVEKYNKYKDTDKRKGYEAVITALQHLFKTTFANELHAATTFDTLEYALFKSVMFFEPRAKVGASIRYYPQDVFVMPEFSDFETGAKVGAPIDGFAAGRHGSNQLIVAKTGYGKSIYLQSLTLCSLHKRYLSEFKAETPGGLPEAQENELYRLSKSMHVPDDLHVISVPAKVYTACYKKGEEYAPYIEDFVGMYLMYMWSCLTPERQDALVLKLSGVDREKNMDALKSYLRSLASNGQLVLVLDSFDEVPAGNMRTSYIKALQKFCREFCKVSGDMGTGSAHILISSRQMSEATMKRLQTPFQNPLDQSYQCRVWGIDPLSDTQREEFVTRWLRVFKNQENQSTKPAELLALIENNHYYSAYADNPYMLSVMCQSHTRGVSDIASEFINTLIQRMKKMALWSRTATPI